jgi:hypothetical protein
MSTYEALKYTFTGANITGIPTSAVSSGTFADARISSGSVTQHVTAVTQAQSTWTPAVNDGGITGVYGRYSRTGNLVTCVGGGYFNSRTSTSSNDAFQVSGLPITSYNGGTSSGSGYFGFNNQLGSRGVLNVPPNSTTIDFYSDGPNIGTTTTRSTGHIYDALRNQADYPGGLRISKRNMSESSNVNNNYYFFLFIVYMV